MEMDFGLGGANILLFWIVLVWISGNIPVVFFNNSLGGFCLGFRNSSGFDRRAVCADAFRFAQNGFPCSNTQSVANGSALDYIGRPGSWSGNAKHRIGKTSGILVRFATWIFFSRHSYRINVGGHGDCSVYAVSTW
jgi:hypothetical protein